MLTLIWAAIAGASGGQSAGSAPEPPPLPAIDEGWAELMPTEITVKKTIRCKATGVVTAEFHWDGKLAHVTSIDGAGHRLSTGEAKVIDQSIKGLEYLDRVELLCFGPQEAMITVYGNYRRKVSIVCNTVGFSGTDGHAVPYQETEPLRAINPFLTASPQSR
jgi:hypothetical protein